MKGQRVQEIPHVSWYIVVVLVAMYYAPLLLEPNQL